jgi:hypothetical protein
VTSAGQQNATPFGVAFCSSRAISRRRSQNTQNASRKGPLPAGALACSIRLAYQAADASHPKRAERARRRARTFRRIDYSFCQARAADTPIGRALPEESTGRTESIQRTGRNSCGVSVQRSARQQRGHSSGDCGRLRGAGCALVCRMSSIAVLQWMYPGTAAFKWLFSYGKSYLLRNRKEHVNCGSARVIRSQAQEFPVRTWTLRQAKEVQRQVPSAAELGNAMHQTAHCQEVNA